MIIVLYGHFKVLLLSPFLPRIGLARLQALLFINSYLFCPLSFINESIFVFEHRQKLNFKVCQHIIKLRSKPSPGLLLTPEVNLRKDWPFSCNIMQYLIFDLSLIFKNIHIVYHFFSQYLPRLEMKFMTKILNPPIGRL